MLLAIDIGNTNITVGVFNGRKLVRKFDIPTLQYSLKRLKKSLGRIQVEDTVICSVVPKASKAINSGLVKLTGRKPYNIGKEIRVPVKNRYRRPREVGQDRLVNAYAGIMLFGAPLIVIDFGTAVTFDIISKDREYLGGLILPGLSISLEALAEHTALLPQIKLTGPGEFIGRDTKNSMLSGLIYGFSEMTDGLVSKIRKKLRNRARVIGTGSNIGLMAKYCRSIDKVEKDLTLNGLERLYRNA